MKEGIKKFFSRADKIRIGYGLVFLLLLTSLGLNTYHVRIFIKQSKRVHNTNEFIINVEHIAGSIKDAETGFRGYLIMNDSVYLQPYNNRLSEKMDSLCNFSMQLTDDTLQKINLVLLKSLMASRFDIFEEGLKIFARNNNPVTDSLKAVVAKGKITMDSIRALVKLMQLHEKGIMKIREVNMTRTSRSIEIINIASLLVSILVAFYSVNNYTKENKARTHADAEAERYRNKLQDQVDALRQANEELVTLRRDERFASTGRIARTIAHEVRNPLTNINLAVEQIKEEIGNQTPESNTLLDMISRNSARINQLVTELLNSTRFSELNFGKRSINELMDEALMMASDRIELNHVTVIKKYSADICDVVVDPDKIKIAFLNIIVNAIEAMETNKGRLSIRTAGEDRICYIYITDNGHGMDEEALQRLFEPYFTKKPKGNGLGMTNTQNIVLNHKGTIRVESSPGKGTTFIIGLRFPEPS